VGCGVRAVRCWPGSGKDASRLRAGRSRVPRSGSFFLRKLDGLGSGGYSTELFER
jgi:hypothetical protein